MSDNIEDEVDKVFTREDLHEIVFAVCCTLFRHGIKEVHIGGLMRILGVDDARAAEHDEELIMLDKEFEQAMIENGEEVVPSDTIDVKIPSGTTIH